MAPAVTEHRFFVGDELPSTLPQSTMAAGRRGRREAEAMKFYGAGGLKAEAALKPLIARSLPTAPEPPGRTASPPRACMSAPACRRPFSGRHRLTVRFQVRAGGVGPVQRHLRRGRAPPRRPVQDLPGDLEDGGEAAGREVRRREAARDREVLPAALLRLGEGRDGRQGRSLQVGGVTESGASAETAS